VSSTLFPTSKDKEEIIKGCGVDKKRLESFFYRMRNKLKQKQEAEGAAASASDGQKVAEESAPVGAAMPTVPPTATAAAPTPPTAAIPNNNDTAGA
jgi:hypothetical protein